MQALDFQEPVVFFSNGVGDSLLALPSLRALASLWPGKLTVICEKFTERLGYQELPVKQIVHILPPNRMSRRKFYGLRTAAMIRQSDLFMSLVPWSSQSLEQLVTGTDPAVSIGFGDEFEIVLARDFEKHSSELLFDMPLLFDASLKLEDFSRPPQYSQRSLTTAREILSYLSPAVWILTVHCDTAEEKNWSLQRFETVLRRFLEAHPDFIALIVGMSSHAFEIKGLGERIIQCCGLPLDVTMWLIDASDLFLGVDSCMMHAADLHRVPGVGLFGPTQPVEFGFRFGPHRHVHLGDSMDSISCESVLEALEEIFAEVAARNRPRRYSDNIVSDCSRSYEV